MSSRKQEQVTCPGCGTIGEFTMWRSINTKLDPEMKAKVRDRSAFAYKCPKCGKTFTVDYGFLYHQMHKLQDRIKDILRPEYEKRNEVMPETGLIRLFEPFMERNGYRDGRGWWVKK